MSESGGRTADEELAELYRDFLEPQFATVEAAVAAVERAHIPDIKGWGWETQEQGDATYPTVRTLAPCGCKQVFRLRATLLGNENWIAPGELEMCTENDCKFNYTQSYEAAARGLARGGAV